MTNPIQLPSETAMAAARELASVEAELYKAEIGNQILKEMVLSQDTELTALRADLAAATISNHGEWSTLMADVHDYFADEKADRSGGRVRIVLTLLARLRSERDRLRADLAAKGEENIALQKQLTACADERLELIDGVFHAISMVGTHTDEFCDEDPPEMANGSPEWESLHNLRGHLEGSLIGNDGEYLARDRFPFTPKNKE